jgi:ribulose-phosphate 3-epimerase
VKTLILNYNWEDDASKGMMHQKRKILFLHDMPKEEKAAFLDSLHFAMTSKYFSILCFLCEGCSFWCLSRACSIFKAFNLAALASPMRLYPLPIAPSILSANFAKLGEEILKLENASADYIHIDVMDGSFVPNITIGNEVIKSIRSFTKIPFDTHLMINNPDNHIKAFADAGSDIITIHAEASTHLDRSIDLIKSYGKKAGVSIVPSTNENILDYILEKIDLVLVMTVNPGFGGQKFLTSQLKKIENIRKKIENINKNIELEVDGGVNNINAKSIINAGANVLVSGSYIFSNDSYKLAIESLRK